MAQLRAKQIKLAAAGDLLIGGTGGNGTVLTKGIDGQVLKIIAGGLAYADNTAADISFAPEGTIAADTVQAALVEVASDAATALSTAIATEVTDRNTAIAAVGDALDARLDTAESDIVDLQAELDATQTGAGLETGGTYVAPTGLGITYIGGATSLKNADVLLDAAIKVLADDLAELTGGEGVSLATLQDELDAVEAALGFDANGTLGAPYTSSEYIGTATLKGAVELLDAALFIVEGDLAQEILDRAQAITDAIAAEVTARDAAIAAAVAAEATLRGNADTALQTELDALEVTVGSKADGTANLYANGNYIVQGAAAIPEDDTDPENIIPAVPAIAPDSHTVAIGKLDSFLKAEEVARGAADTFIQAELDATQAGAGLAVTGAYSAEATSNYLKSADFTAATLTPSLKSADLILDGVIKDLADDLAALTTGSGAGLTALQTEVDLIETGLGFGGTGLKPDFASTNFVGAADTVVDAIEALDAQAQVNADDIVAANDRIDALGAAFNYVGVLGGVGFTSFAGGADAGTATDLGALEANQKNPGDYFKVSADGYYRVGAGTAFFVKANDGIVWNTSAGVDVIDNTNSNVLAGANIAVTGSTDVGFTVALDGIVPTANGGTGKAALESVTAGSDMVVLGAGATGSVVNAFTVDIVPGNIDFTALAQVGTPSDGRFLRWNGTTSQIEYVTAAQLGSTIRAEEDFAPATAANAAVTLARAPTGDIQVFINGVKLKKAGYSLAGSTVTLVDSANGYGIEAGDTLAVSYSYAG